MRALGDLAVGLEPRVLPVGALLLAAVMLGGATHPGHFSDVLLQVASIPILIWGSAKFFSAQMDGLTWGAVVIAMLCAALPVLQLMPIVPTKSGGSATQRIFEIRQLLGDASRVEAISTSPRATILATLAGLPSLAVFFGTARLSLRGRRQLALAVLLLGGAAVFLGLLQVSEGPNSGWRFFSVTNPSEAVGFFANRNHFSAFLYVMLLLSACWAIDAAWKFRDASPKRRSEAALAVPLIASLTAITIFVAAQAYTRSRAGLGLGMVALVAALLLSITGPRRSTGLTASRLVLGAVAAGVFISVQFALYRLLERFGVDPLSDARISFAANTIEAARANLPFGSGLGTFVPVYGLFEESSDSLIDTFANRAHNDILEGWLETGVPGVIIFACFIAWFLLALRGVWTQHVGNARLDTLLARAASIAIALLLLHSLVDYPLRTAALQCIFAMSCAYLIPTSEEKRQDNGLHSQGSQWSGVSRAVARRKTVESLTSTEQRALARSARSIGRGVDSHDAVAPAVATRSEKWGRGIEWPAQWRQQSRISETDPGSSKSAVSRSSNKRAQSEAGTADQPGSHRTGSA